MTKFKTESGSIYSVETRVDGTQWITREPTEGNEMRKDSDSIQVFYISDIIVGSPVSFVMEPLGGPSTFATVRKTTPLVEVV